MKKPEPARTIHHLRVHLVDTSPAVWRRIEIESDDTLASLHAAIVASMPWDDRAHHEFFAAGKRWGSRNLRREKGLEEEKKGVIGKVAPAVGDHFEYEYDFDDEWLHDVVVEAITPAEEGAKYPRAVDGESAAPLDGCGGTFAWSEILEARQDDDEEVRAEVEELVGEGFDPDVMPASLGITPATRPGDVPATAAELAAVLESFGPLLTRRLRDRVLELGDSAGPVLIELLAGAGEDLEDAKAWARLHATKLLGLMKHAPAVPALTTIVETVDLGSPLGQQASEALIEIGAPALDALLGAQARATDPDRRGVLTLLLGHLGAKDDRVYALLVAELERDPAGAADALGQFGDARAVEPLLARLDVAIAGDEDAEVVYTLGAVAEHLGGTLTDAQAEACSAADDELEARGEEAAMGGDEDGEGGEGDDEDFDDEDEDEDEEDE